MVKFKGAQDKNHAEVIDYQRLNSHYVAHFGRVIAVQAGTFTLHWDNKYSWTRSKELHYFVQIE
jgi:hypothetical protein